MAKSCHQVPISATVRLLRLADVSPWSCWSTWGTWCFFLVSWGCKTMKSHANGEHPKIQWKKTSRNLSEKYSAQWVLWCTVLRLFHFFYKYIIIYTYIYNVYIRTFIIYIYREREWKIDFLVLQGQPGTVGNQCDHAPCRPVTCCTC